MDASVGDKGDYVFGPFRLNPVTRTVYRNGTPIKLTARPFDTLLYLVQAEGRLVEKDELMAAVWAGRVVEDGNLNTSIFALRKALQGEAGDEGLIVTVAGRGYRLGMVVRRETSPAPADIVAALSPAQPEAPGVAAARLPYRLAEYGRAGRLVLGGAGLFVLVILIMLRFGPPRPWREAAFTPPPHSVAVLPFDNMTGDPAQGYFGDGIAEELISALGRVPPIRVSSRVSAFSFKNTPATTEEIARKLNVGMVLEGSVRGRGGRLRVGVQLIDARTGFQVWSRTYDRDPHDLLAVEEDIGEAVAASLQVTLVQGEASRLVLGGTSDPAAFDAFVHGQLIMRAGKMSDYPKSIALFTEAIRRDPNFARAYASRSSAATSAAMNPVHGYTPATQAADFKAALEDADKAIALAPDLAAGHSARAHVLDNGFLRLKDAAEEAKRARDLEPGNPVIADTYAMMVKDLGRFDEAIAAARLAASLDPMRPNVWYVLGDVQFTAGQYKESLATLRHEAELRGKLSPFSEMVTAYDELMLGHAAEAAAACNRVPDEVEACLALVSPGGEAEHHLARALAGSGVKADDLAEIYLRMGDKERALSALEQGLRTHDGSLSKLLADRFLDPIRQDQRFIVITKSLDLPPFTPP
jgi:TolB-like protein/DNA-binding winged helix-turn-helix (wHTH) protein